VRRQVFELAVSTGSAAYDEELSLHRDRHHSVRLTARDGSSAALSDRMASFTEREQVVDSAGWLARDAKYGS